MKSTPQSRQRNVWSTDTRLFLRPARLIGALVGDTCCNSTRFRAGSPRRDAGQKAPAKPGPEEPNPANERRGGRDPGLRFGVGAGDRIAAPPGVRSVR